MAHVHLGMRGMNGDDICISPVTLAASQLQHIFIFLLFEISHRHFLEASA